MLGIGIQGTKIQDESSLSRAANHVEQLAASPNIFQEHIRQAVEIVQVLLLSGRHFLRTCAATRLTGSR